MQNIICGLFGHKVVYIEKLEPMGEHYLHATYSLYGVCSRCNKTMFYRSIISDSEVEVFGDHGIIQDTELEDLTITNDL